MTIIIFDCEYRCIMAPASSKMEPTFWSSCSLEYLALAFEHGMDYCLRNKPTAPFDGPVCGNGFVEQVQVSTVVKKILQTLYYSFNFLLGKSIPKNDLCVFQLIQYNASVSKIKAFITNCTRD